MRFLSQLYDCMPSMSTGLEVGIVARYLSQLYDCMLSMSSGLEVGIIVRCQL